MKKYALVFLSVFLFISAPFAAHANIVTATGKYLINAVKHVPGAVRVDATNTATGAKHVIKHGISSADLGKGIGAGIVGMAVGSGVGLAFQAITGLALDAVDWVLDPANNRIVYTEEAVNDPTSPPNTPSYYVVVDGSKKHYCMPLSTCAAVLDSVYPDLSHGSCFAEQGTNRALCPYVANGKTYHNTIASVVNPNYDSNGGTVEKYLPIDTVAQKVISNAAAGQVDSQKTIEDYVTHLAKEGKLDTELDNSSDITPSEEPENPEEPQNPTEPKECPSGSVKVDDVCVKIPDSDSDEPLFCDSSEFTKKVCDWIDWTQAEPEEVTPEQIDIKEVEADNSNKIDMSGECPAPYQLNFSISGYAQNHSISYEPLCNALILLKPIFVGSGALSGMFILMGYSRASNTGVNG